MLSHLEGSDLEGVFWDPRTCISARAPKAADVGGTRAFLRTTVLDCVCPI